MSVHVQCPCSSTNAIALVEPPSLAATYSYHPLASLYFCEECDAIKCPRCVTQEIACFYCPNCLFEVPTASVKGEKNRCARNCFVCPQCTNTLAVVATDPETSADPSQPAASTGEAPYYLACSACKWDSKEVGLSFDKATGLAGAPTHAYISMAGIDEDGHSPSAEARGRLASQPILRSCPRSSRTLPARRIERTTRCLVSYELVGASCSEQLCPLLGALRLDGQPGGADALDSCRQRGGFFPR